MPAIDKAEVLRYLGHKGQDVSGPLDRLIDDCIAECMKAARPRHISRRFGFMLPPAGGVDLTGTSLTLAGADIRAHLAGGSALVLMAATLGVGVDNLIKRYESADLTRSLILDACATALIESVCDEAEAELRRQAEREGKGLTGRYSPGYGDLPLDVQPRFAAVLDTGRRIGLCCSETNILIPRKSVTAVMGILDQPPDRAPSPASACGSGTGSGCGRRCSECRLTDCLYRKEE